MGFQKVCFERQPTASHGKACWCRYKNFCVNIKHVQINVEDGTGLVQVILWRKEKKCTAQRCLIHECNSNCYICVIGEVKDYWTQLQQAPSKFGYD